MVSVLEAPTDELIRKVAEHLKQETAIKPPAWLPFVKTGAQVERKVSNPQEFWYMRCASLLRRIYLEKGIGVGRLRTWYGGRKCYGTSLEHHVDAGGKIIREALKQLESAGFIKKETVGRSIAPKGKSLLDKTSMEFYGGERRGRRVEPIPAEVAKPKRTRKVRTPKTVAAPEPDGTKSKRKAGKSKTGKPASGAEG
jgi:small subunit ribosomal protein S19e